MTPRDTAIWPPSWLAETAPAVPMTWDQLRPLRWGPAIGDHEPGIDMPVDSWRWRAANLPHAAWVRWRHRTAALLEGMDQTAEAIRAAEHAASVEVTQPVPSESRR